MKFHNTPITTTEITFGMKKIDRKNPASLKPNLVSATAKTSREA